MPPKPMVVPKAVKWQHILPDALNQIQDKLSQGWDVAYCDGSRKSTLGLSYAGNSVWFGLGDVCNAELPVPVQEKQSITGAELRAALCALHSKQPGVKLHVVTDSELLFLGLKGKCGKWQRQGWVGSRGRWLM